MYPTFRITQTLAAPTAPYHFVSSNHKRYQEQHGNKVAKECKPRPPVGQLESIGNIQEAIDGRARDKNGHQQMGVLGCYGTPSPQQQYLFREERDHERGRQHGTDTNWALS